MKITQATLGFTLLAAANAAAKHPANADDSAPKSVGVRRRRHLLASTAAATNADDSAAKSSGVRQLRNLKEDSFSLPMEAEEVEEVNCWPGHNQPAAWHRDTSMGWANGVCVFNIDCGETSFASEKECCDGAYAHQWSEACLKNMPDYAPIALLESEELVLAAAIEFECNQPEAWHRDTSMGWSNGVCVFNVDCEETSYASEGECCAGAYANQWSEACFKNMAEPPTQSPIAEGAVLDVWYADWPSPFEDAACVNAAPLPPGEATYPTMLECCNSVYAAQTSGKCVAAATAAPAAADEVELTP